MFIVPIFLAILPTVYSAAAAKCTPNSDNYITGLCYDYIPKKMSFDAAHSYCLKYNPSFYSRMAVIQSAIQNNFLATLVQGSASKIDSFWIGLSRNDTKSPFIWDDGSSMGWSNFEKGYPDQTNNNVAEKLSNARWVTVDSKRTLTFVCSYIATNDPTPAPTVTPPATDCSFPYAGKIAIAFELNSARTSGIDDIHNFMKYNFYNVRNYEFDDEQITEAIQIPYPGTDNYDNAGQLMQYKEAQSLNHLLLNLYSLWGGASDSTDPTIKTALKFIRDKRQVWYESESHVLLLLGSNDKYVNDSSTLKLISQLKGQGYYIITVGFGGNFAPLASDPSLNFQFTGDNGQQIANDISRILCHHTFRTVAPTSVTPSGLHLKQ